MFDWDQLLAFLVSAVWHSYQDWICMRLVSPVRLCSVRTASHQLTKVIPGKTPLSPVALQMTETKYRGLKRRKDLRSRSSFSQLRIENHNSDKILTNVFFRLLPKQLIRLPAWRTISLNFCLKSLTEPRRGMRYEAR